MSESSSKIAKDVSLGKNVEVGRFSIIDEGCQIGDDVIIKDFVRLAKNTKIGDRTYIDSYVRSSGDNSIGSDVTIRYGATIARKVTVEDWVFISPNVMTVYTLPNRNVKGGIRIGERSFISTGTVIGIAVKIGRKCLIGTQSFLSHCVIGNEVTLRDKVSIGSRGLNVVKNGNEISFREGSKQVHIKDCVDISTGSVIHRGYDRNTEVGYGTVIGTLCNVGHDTLIGERCIIGTRVHICGRVNIGNDVRINPDSCIKNRVTLGNFCTVGIGSLVMSDVPAWKTYVGRPAIELERFKRRLKRLKVEDEYEESEALHLNTIL